MNTQPTGTLAIGCLGWQRSRAQTAGRSIAEQRANALSAYASQFDFVEVDRSFHTLPNAETLASWREAVPAAFKFYLHVPKTITHERRLREVGTAIARVSARLRQLELQLGGLVFRMPGQGIANLDGLRDLLDRRVPQDDWIFDLNGTRWDTTQVEEVIRAYGCHVRGFGELKQHGRAANVGSDSISPIKLVLTQAHLTQPPSASVNWARRIYAALTAGHDVTVTYQRASNAERFDPARRLTQAIVELGKTREADGTTSALA